MSRALDKIKFGYFEEGNNASIFGIPVKDLSREELISCIGLLCKTIRNQRDDLSRYLETISSLRKKDL